MTESAATDGGSSAKRAGAGPGQEGEGQIDWLAAERSPEFRDLIKKRRAFVLPATIFFFTWYFGFIILAGYAENFMGTDLGGGVTVGYALALTQFIMVWVLCGVYLRKADRDFDPLARRAAQTALDAGAGRGTGDAARSERTDPEVRA